MKPWPGAELKKDPHAEYVPYTGDLLVERQVGRGRIVASAFRLTGTGVDRLEGLRLSFQRLPAAAAGTRVLAGPRIGAKVRFRWAGSHGNLQRLDAAQMTAVRYFARDTGVECDDYAADIMAAQAAVNWVASYCRPFSADACKRQSDQWRRIICSRRTRTPRSLRPGSWPRAGRLERLQPRGPGRAAALNNAAGISVPAAELHCLGGGRLLVRARAGQLDRFPVPGPRGVGLDRSPADRHCLHGRGDPSGPTEHRLRPLAERDRRDRDASRAIRGSTWRAIRSFIRRWPRATSSASTIPAGRSCRFPGYAPEQAEEDRKRKSRCLRPAASWFAGGATIRN